MTSRYWDSMGNLVKSLVNSIASIAALLVLLMLSIFIAALLGMQIFGGRFDPDSRSNFNGIVPSTVTVFQVPRLGISDNQRWKCQFLTCDLACLCLCQLWDVRALLTTQGLGSSLCLTPKRFPLTTLSFATNYLSSIHTSSLYSSLHCWRRSVS